MITQLEPYNEIHTKSLLRQLFSKGQISINEIYTLLGTDNINNGRQYTLPDINSDIVSFTPAMLKPQGANYTAAIQPYENLVRNEYINGNYFHIRFQNQGSTERMIINIKTQQDAVNIMKYLSLKETENLYKSLPTAINSMKFYALHSLGRRTALKCDKIVIYYERRNRDDVYQMIIEAARVFNIPSANFLTPISGFYHLAGRNDGSYRVGIGVEISGTSFTKERTKNIFHKLTGRNFSNSDTQTQYGYSYQEPNATIFVDELYSHGVIGCKDFLTP